MRGQRIINPSLVSRGLCGLDRSQVSKLSPWMRSSFQNVVQTSQPRTHRSICSTTALSKKQDLEQAAAEMAQAERIDRRYTHPDYLTMTGRDRLPQDWEITDPQIYVLDAGTLEGPLATKYVMQHLKPNESLRMFQPFTPAKGDQPSKYALCKIVDKAEEYKRERENKEKKKVNAKPKVKEVELTWSISDNDLDTKMRQMAEFLAKGMKVEVVLGKKKRGRKVTEEEAQDLLKRVRHEIQTHQGHEPKKPSGNVGEVMRLQVESKVSKKG